MKEHFYQPQNNILSVERAVKNYLLSQGIISKQNLVIEDAFSYGSVEIDVSIQDIAKVISFVSAQEHGELIELSRDVEEKIIFATIPFTRGRIPFGKYKCVNGCLELIDLQKEERNTYG